MRGNVAIQVMQAYLAQVSVDYPVEMMNLASDIARIEEGWSEIDRKINTSNDEINKIIASLLASDDIYRYYSTVYSGGGIIVGGRVVSNSIDGYYDILYLDLNKEYQEIFHAYQETLNNYDEGKIKKSEYLKINKKYAIASNKIKSKFENFEKDLKHIEKIYNEAYQKDPNFTP